MDTTEIKCKCCDAPMKYISGATRIKCEYCGTEYVLKQKNDSDNVIKQIDYMNRGAVFTSYIPEGWNVRIIEDDKEFSRFAAITMGLRLDSPDGAVLFFYPFAYFRNFNTGGDYSSKITQMRNYSYDPLSMTRTRCLPPFNEYVTQRIKEIFPLADNITIQKMTDIDDFLAGKARSFSEETTQKLKYKTQPEWGKYSVSFEANNEKRSALFVSLIAYKKDAKPPIDETEKSAAKPQETASGQTENKKSGNLLNDFLSFGMSGGIIGAKKRGENPDFLRNLKDIDLPKIDLKNFNLKELLGADIWGKCFDILLIANGSNAESYNDIFNDFTANVKYTNLYYALQADELRQAERIMVEGQMQRTQNAVAASQRLQKTLSETSDIINRGYENRSHIMDDISRKRSEANRGVNSFTAYDNSTVEASVSFEHVYQKGSSFVGSKDGGLELGPDWVELKKN